jgi:hypothetical protein
LLFQQATSNTGMGNRRSAGGDSNLLPKAEAGDLGGVHKLGPEGKLLAAIIEKALSDATQEDKKEFTQGRTEIRRYCKKSALQWILSESGEPWGFIWICELLEADYERLRRLVKHCLANNITFYWRSHKGLKQKKGESSIIY